LNPKPRPRGALFSAHIEASHGCSLFRCDCARFRVNSILEGAERRTYRKGASDTVAVITEETASRVEEETTKLIIEEDRLE